MRALLALSAAFAILDHNILLQRFKETISVKGNVLPGFELYPSDKFQFV